MTTVEELIEEFADLDEREACQVLEEIGQDLPATPESLYVKTNLVPGCQSRVWMTTEINPDGNLSIHADSDAFVVKGLVRLVLTMFQGQSPSAALEVDYADIFDRLGLGRMILPQRKNGLLSMVSRIRQFAAATLGREIDGEAAQPVTPNAVAPSRVIADISHEFPCLMRPLESGSLPVYLDTASSAQKPRCVIDKQREVQEQYYANAFRGRYTFGAAIDDAIEAARATVAAFIGANDVREVVFSSGATMAINLVANSWGRRHIRPESEIVVTELEHHANFVPWQAIANQVGAKLRIWPVDDQWMLDMSVIDDIITDRTSLVAVTSMSNVVGSVTPLPQIVARARSVGAKILVDAAQSIAHAPMDVAALDIDFMCFSGHKLYGPTGVGVLYGKYELLQSMDPLVLGGHMIESVGRDHSSWAAPPARFEAGTLPIVSIIGLGEAIDFVQSIGLTAIADHEHQLLKLATERLNAIPGLQIVGPPLAHKGAIVSFTIDGVASEDLAHRLDHQGVFTRHGHHCAMILHDRMNVPATTRASFGVYNTVSDVERLAAAITDAVAAEPHVQA